MHKENISIFALKKIDDNQQQVFLIQYIVIFLWVYIKYNLPVQALLKTVLLIAFKNKSNDYEKNNYEIYNAAHSNNNEHKFDSTK